MKKLILSITAVIIFFMPLSLTYNEQKAHANIISKPLTITAKKVAKDLAKDSAVAMAEHILFEKMMKDFLETDLDKVDPGYAPVCLDGAKKLEDCPPDKRAQVKKDLTSADKSTLATKVEQVLEKKTNTSSKWQKFLDFFVPIFLISGLVSFFDATLDGDSQSFIDEIALQALIDTGFLKPLSISSSSSDWNPKDFTAYVQSANVSVNTDEFHPFINLELRMLDGKEMVIHHNGRYSKSIKSAETLKLSTLAGYEYVDGTSFTKSYASVRVDSFWDGSVNVSNGRPKIFIGDIKDHNAQLLNNEARIAAVAFLNGFVASENDLNEIINTWFAMASAYFPVEIEVPDLVVPPVQTDYGTQTGLDKIKNPDGTTTLPGVDSFTYTYNNTYIYPAPDSTTGWKDKTTGEDITVAEDEVIVDGGEPINPDKPPTQEDEPPNTDKDKDKIKDKSRDWSGLLTDRFPFSLPWDFMYLIQMLYADPITPSWEVSGTEKIPFNLKINLSFLDPYIGWFRTFVLLSFIVSVIFMHGRFMGGSK